MEPFNLRRLVEVSDFILQPATFFRRQAFEAVGHLDEGLHWCMDWDLWISLVERGYRGTILPEVLFFYRRRGASVSRRCEEPEVHLRLMRYLVEKHRHVRRCGDAAAKYVVMRRCGFFVLLNTPIEEPPTVMLRCSEASA